MEKASVARKEGLVPLGLAPGAIVKRPLKQGQPLCYDDVELDESQTIFHLRKLQDKMVATALKQA